MLLMHSGDERLGRDAFLFGAQHDGGAVRIVGADIGRVVTDEFLEANPHISLDIFNQMTEVDGAVGVGQSGSDEERTFHGRNFSRSACFGRCF